MIQKHKIPYHLIADFDFSISDLSAWLVSDFELRILNELSRSKLRGYRRPIISPDSDSVTPECFHRGSSSGVAWIPA